MTQSLILLFVLIMFPMPWGITIIHFLVDKKFWFKKKIKFSVFILAILVWVILFLNLKYFYSILFWKNFENIYLKIFGLLILFFATFIEISTNKILSTKRIFGFSELTQNSDELIINGIYKYARHPRYLEHPLWFVGLGLFFGYPIVIWFGIYLFLAFWITSIFEEKELISRYGEKYLEYKKNTPAFFISLK